MTDNNSNKKDSKNPIKKLFTGNNEPKYICPKCNKSHKMDKFSCNPRCWDVYCIDCLEKHCKSLLGKESDCDCPMKKITGCKYKLDLPGNKENLQVPVSSHGHAMKTLQKYLKKGKQSGSAKDDGKFSEQGSNSRLDQSREPSTEQLHIVSADTRKEDTTPITRPALGRNASIGELYDAKTDCKLTKYTILLENKKDQLKAPRMDINRSWKVESLAAENVFDRMAKLEVCPETQLNVLSGQLEPRGHAEYLNSREWDVEGEDKIHGAFTCTLMLQAVNIPLEAVGNWMSLKEDPRLGEATHVVVGIDYGLRIVVSVTKSLLNEKTVAASKAGLKAFLDQVVKALNNPEKLTVSESANLVVAANDLQDYKITIFSDMPFDNLNKLQTMNEVIEFAKRMVNKNSAADSGVIFPIRYHLLSISAIAASLKVEVSSKIYQCAINSNDEGVNKFVELLDKTEGKFINLKHFLDNIKSNEQYVSDEILKDVEKGTALAEDIVKFKERLRRSLQNSKSSIGNFGGILSDYMIQLQMSDYPKNTDEFLLTIVHVQKSLAFVSSLKELGVICMDKEQSLEELRDENELKEFCAFFYSHDEKTVSEFNDNKKLFLSLIEGKKRLQNFEENSNSNSLLKNLQFVAADINCCGEQLGHLGQNTQVYYYSESCNLSNVLKKIEKNNITAAAKPTRKLDALNNTPIKFAIVKLPCPSSFKGPCSEELKYWQCSECSSLLEFDFGNKCVYCTCGQGQLTDFEFKCNSQEHGESFVKCDTTMTDLLLKMEQVKCTNILLLGETGVGKSTWINAFVNYGAFRSLEEASQSELIYAIPTSFSMTINKRDTPISVGSSHNECFDVGKSSTQKPTAYRLLFDDNQNHIRLIDTPGMGDTRGIEQDKYNMEVTMKFLSQFDDLHAICILLKPNESKLTNSFLFCINQILTHLHKDASKNIIFCFTNSRGTQFEAGQTSPLLKEYLKGIKDKHQAPIILDEKIIYCFDSEAFRYLCALSKGAKVKRSSDKGDYSTSWNQSVESTKQLLNYINTLDPHRLHDTVSLSNARNLIDKLTEPMVDIGVNIEQNRVSVAEQKKTIEKLTTESKNLEEQLKIKMIEYEPEPLEQPRMVCASSKCKKIVQPDDSDKKKFIYEQVCHEPCWLDGVEVNSYPNPVLQKCAVIDDKGHCKRCGCRWEEHLHISYTYREIIKENPILEGQLHETIDKKTSIEKAAKMCDTTVKELEAERDLITKYAAKFAHFLKTKSILPYNDAFDDYMAHLIENAKFKDDAQQMESLKKVREMYKEQIKLLNEVLTDDSVNVEHIHEYKEELIKQKHSGAQLNKILNVANEMAEKHAALKDMMCRPAAEVTRNVNKNKKEVLDSLQQLLEINANGD